MRRPASTSRPWPFWLLIAAWLCANVPANVTLSTLVWAKSAPHFTHQHDLKAAVSALLAGEPRENKIALAIAEATQRTTPSATAVVSVEIKKSIFECCSESPVVIATLAPLEQPLHPLRALPAPVREVALPPPRSAQLA